jgi:pyruvate kinase
MRKASDIKKIYEVLGLSGVHIKIKCKIENLEGLQNHSKILKATAELIVARDDLGMEKHPPIPPPKKKKKFFLHKNT